MEVAGKEISAIVAMTASLVIGEFLLDVFTVRLVEEADTLEFLAHVEETLVVVEQGEDGEEGRIMNDEL